MSALSAKLQAGWQRFINFRHIALDFFLAVLLLGLVYRFRVYYGLYNVAVPPFDFSPAEYPFLSLFWYNIFEVIFALLCLGFVLVLLTLRRTGWVRRYPRLFSFKGLILIQLFLLFLAMAYGTHHRLMFTMHMGLEQDAILEADTFSLDAYVSMISIYDLIFILAPLAFFWMFRLLKGRAVQLRNILALGLVILLGLFFVGGSFFARPVLATELKLNPVLFTTYDIMSSKNLRKTDVEIKNKDQLESLRLVDDSFAAKVSPVKDLPTAVPEKWNILFIILESTGDRYIYDTRYGNEVPMPFLKQLAQKSLRLENHVAPTNTSPRAIYSLLSGLYPVPTNEFFSTRKDIVIPSLFQFIGKSYDKFLVTPAALSWYFPFGFMKNNGLKEMYGFRNLPKKEFRLKWKHAAHEADGADVMISRMKRAKEPFVGIYITFAPHWPYFEFAPEIDLFKNGKAPRHSWRRMYYNNLRLQDNQIKRMVQSLEKNDLLDDTIIVLVGDHSEAFGLHKNNWIHSRATYQENIEVPAYIYQPRLFKPRTEKRLTAHIDILPTLLDAMQIRYNKSLIQGESIFQREFARKYVFIYGNENTLSSIHQKKQTKVQFSLKHQTCWAFELKKDPFEKNKLTCDQFQEQKTALLRFFKHQTTVMPAYNQALLDDKEFFGQRHYFRESSILTREQKLKLKSIPASKINTIRPKTMQASVEEKTDENKADNVSQGAGTL